MEQDRRARDRELAVGSDIAHRPQVHIMEDRLFTVLVAGVFHAEEDADLLLAVDADADADVVAGMGKPILLLLRIPLLPYRFR
jgi:hypothetical protein